MGKKLPQTTSEGPAATGGVPTCAASGQPLAEARFSLRFYFLLAVAATAVLATILALFRADTSLPLVLIVEIVVGIFGAVLLLLGKLPMTFGNMMALGLLIGYFFGYAPLMASGHVLPDTWPAYWAKYYAEASEASLLHATALVSWVAALSALLGCVRIPPMQLDLGGRIASRPPIGALIVGLLVLGVAFLKGDVGYMGAATQSGTVSVLGSLAVLIAAPIASTAFYAATRRQNDWRRTLLFIIFVLAEIALIPIGRRVFFASTLLAAVIWGAGHLSRSIWRRLLIIVIALVVANSLAFGLFTAMRQYHSSPPKATDLTIKVKTTPRSTAPTTVADPSQSRPTVTTSVAHPPQSHPLQASGQVAGGVAQFFHDPVGAFRNLAENVGPRMGSLLAYLGLHTDRFTWSSELHGRLARYSVALLVPHVLWAGKSSLLAKYSSSEALTHPAMGLPVFDGPNTLVTEGYADFGLAGAVAYPLFILALYTAFVVIVRRLLGRWAAAFMQIAVLLSLFAAEQTLAAHLVTLRNLVLIAVAMAMVKGLAAAWNRWSPLGDQSTTAVETSAFRIWLARARGSVTPAKSSGEGARRSEEVRRDK